MPPKSDRPLAPCVGRWNFSENLSVAVVPANLAGRVAGACLGFWLNGQVTFRRAGRVRRRV